MTSTSGSDLSVSMHDRHEDESILWPLIPIDHSPKHILAAYLVSGQDERLAVNEVSPLNVIGPFLPLERLSLTVGQIEHLRTLDALAQVDPGFTPLILPLSPPCQGFSRLVEGQIERRERLGLPSIEDLLRIEFRDDAPDAATPDIIPLPPRERPRGTGRTSIPKTDDRRSELAARAARLRERSRKGKSR